MEKLNNLPKFTQLVSDGEVLSPDLPESMAHALPPLVILHPHEEERRESTEKERLGLEESRNQL